MHPVLALEELHRNPNESRRLRKGLLVSRAIDPLTGPAARGTGAALGRNLAAAVRG